MDISEDKEKMADHSQVDEQEHQKKDIVKEIPLSKKLDKFYTKPETAEKLFAIAKEFLGLEDDQFFLEPSAGSGAFSNLFSHGTAYDIAPESESVIEADFLTLDSCWERSSIAIGNPPFGKKGKLALEFLVKCAETCDAVAFILPSTFRRWSVQSKIPHSMKLIYDEKLPVDSFTYEGKGFALNCVYQIWCRKDADRFKDYPDLRMKSKPPLSHEDFLLWQHNATEQSKKYLDEDWEIATYRQGYKDYNVLFHKDVDYETVKKIVHQEKPKLQLFFIKPLCNRARDIIENKMDLNALARENLSTPGFGKADFVSYYISIAETWNKGEEEQYDRSS